MRFNSFGAEHLTLVLGIALLILAAVRYMKRQPEAKKYRILKVFTWMLPAIYLFRFIVFLLLESFIEAQMPLMDRLPFHLCTINAIIMPIGVLTKNKTILNYMYAIAMPAAAAAMLTPAMSYYGRYFFLSWQVLFFYIDHGLMVLVPVLAILSGTFRPRTKYIFKVSIFFAVYVAIIYIVNKVFNQNYLFLNYPDNGTVMAFFARYTGNPGYLLPMAILAGVIIFAMYLPWIIRGKTR